MQKEKTKDTEPNRERKNTRYEKKEKRKSVRNAKKKTSEDAVLKIKGIVLGDNTAI